VLSEPEACRRAAPLGGFLSAASLSMQGPAQLLPILAFSRVTSIDGPVAELVRKNRLPAVGNEPGYRGRACGCSKPPAPMRLREARREAAEAAKRIALPPRPEYYRNLFEAR